MKHPLLPIIILFASLPFSLLAQSKQQLKNDSVFLLVKKYFNQRQALSIYSLAGEKFKNELSAETFKHVAEEQLFRFGPIRESSQISFVNNKMSTYKLTFDFGLMQLLMTLDNDDKLELFLFKPYKAEAPDKKKTVGTSNLMRTQNDKKLDTIARTYIQKANTVGLSIGVFRNGITHIYQYGETTAGNNALPDANSIYEIGSISKTFTATLLAYYANQGKVKLTDPISKYLPDSVSSNKELQNVTLLTLINHTSGLPPLPDNFEYHSSDPLDPYKDYKKEYLFAYLKTCKLNNRPGETYAYSNLAVGLLGTILEQVTGKSFEQMVEEIICKPLGMNSTKQHLTPELERHFITIYNEDGKATPPWNFSALAACGSLKSSMNDLLIYVKANMEQQDTRLSKAFDLTHRVTLNKDARVGLGWHIIVVNGVDYDFHDGGTYGCSTFLAFNAEKNFGVIVLSNAAANVDAMATELIKKLQ